MYLLLKENIYHQKNTSVYVLIYILHLYPDHHSKNLLERLPLLFFVLFYNFYFYHVILELDILYAINFYNLLLLLHQNIMNQFHNNILLFLSLIINLFPSYLMVYYHHLYSLLYHNYHLMLLNILYFFFGKNKKTKVII